MWHLLTIALVPVTPIDTLTSGLASIARLPYGTTVAEELQSRPASATAPLTLYEFKGCPFCRRVREVVTYLDLSCTIKPCAAGSRHREEVKQISGNAKPTFPFLVDEGQNVNMFESEDICAHLLKYYSDGAVNTLPAPAEYFYPSSLVTGWMPSLLRMGRGTSVDEGARGRSPPAKQLVLYSYEGNQFCRLVREALAELDLPYELRSTGKGSPRREELKALRGDDSSTAPYLVDPNTGKQLGESADIVFYLAYQYAPRQ